MDMLIIMATLIASTWIGMAIILFKTSFLDDKEESVKK